VAIGDGDRRQHAAGNVGVKAIVVEEPALTEPHERLVAIPIVRSGDVLSVEAIASCERASRALQVRPDPRAQTCSQNLRVSGSVRQLPVARALVS
jgi:hypothetical protein